VINLEGVCPSLDSGNEALLLSPRRETRTWPKSAKKGIS
jgi:hypothetical protein